MWPFYQLNPCKRGQTTRMNLWLPVPSNKLLPVRPFFFLGLSLSSHWYYTGNVTSLCKINSRDLSVGETTVCTNKCFGMVAEGYNGFQPRFSKFSGEIFDCNCNVQLSTMIQLFNTDSLFQLPLRNCYFQRSTAIPTFNRDSAFQRSTAVPTFNCDAFSTSD